jgi:hypothetical protein
LILFSIFLETEAEEAEVGILAGGGRERRRGRGRRRGLHAYELFNLFSVISSH